jgi:hypothetical protein
MGVAGAAIRHAHDDPVALGRGDDVRDRSVLHDDGALALAPAAQVSVEPCPAQLGQRPDMSVCATIFYPDVNQVTMLLLTLRNTHIFYLLT